jgi:F1F0 ATPase subunit 2
VNDAPGDVVLLASAFAFGAALGALYFFGLWATVRRVASRGATLWVPVSFVLRLAVLLAGLYWIGADDWRRWAAALGGVIVVRQAITRRMAAPQPASAQQTSSRRPEHRSP